jgi:hypothetical protein
MVKLTPEQLKRVHIALEQTDGNVPAAAALIGLSREALRKIMAEYPELQSYKGDATPPSEAETIARPALPVVGKDEADLALAMKKADEQVREGFDAIGVSGGALDQAMAFRQFGKFHFQDMRHFIGGGVAKLFADLMSDIKTVREEIADPAAKPDIELQKALREDRSRLVKMALDTYDRVRQAALDAAVIEAKKAEAKNGGKRKNAPAFAPLAMKVEGNVTVNEAKAPAPEPVKAPVPEVAAA